MDRQIVVARYEEPIGWLNGLDAPAIIYNKSAKGCYTKHPVVLLPNFGREGHTYLHHIVDKWDDLADVTIFCQGSVVDHLPSLLQNVSLRNGLAGFWFDLFFKQAATYKCVSGPRLWSGKEWGDNGRLLHWGKWLERINTGELRQADMSLVSWFQWLNGFTNVEVRPEMTIKETVKCLFWKMPEQLTYFPGANFAVPREVIQKIPRSWYKWLLDSLPLHPDPEEAYYLERAWLTIFSEYGRIKVCSNGVGGGPLNIML